MAKMPVTDVGLKDATDTPNKTGVNPNPWDVAQGHANTAEDMGSPRGLGIETTRHYGIVANHTPEQYASYVDEDVRNPEGAS